MLGGIVTASVTMAVNFVHVASGIRHPAMGAQRLSAEDMAVLAHLSLNRLPPVAADPSNAAERRPAPVDFGRRHFNDARVSRNGVV